MSTEHAILTFVSMVNCEPEFARFFLEANDNNLELAVQNYFAAHGGNAATDPSSNQEGAAVPEGLPGYEQPVRAPIAQFNDTLIDHDPAMRLPQRPVQTAAAEHPLEAFRDFKSEADKPGMAPSSEVFGLSKKPRNLAEIYRPPVELCFSGTFEQLREEGRKLSRWLLVNIQSPVEFASQQLNADTWQDETLGAVIKANFLFWQQYFDSTEGAKYCRYYLQGSTSFPHIGVIDPVTGQLVKSWSGFKDAERLMDSLVNYADTPPKDVFADEAMPDAAATTDAAGGVAAAGEEAELAAAIAASLHRAEDAPAQAAPEAEWPAAPEMPAQGEPETLVMRVRLPSGQQWQQTFKLDFTLHELLCAVHHLSGHALSTNKARARQPCGPLPPFILRSAWFLLFSASLRRWTTRRCVFYSLLDLELPCRFLLVSAALVTERVLSKPFFRASVWAWSPQSCFAA